MYTLLGDWNLGYHDRVLSNQKKSCNNNLL